MTKEGPRIATPLKVIGLFVGLTEVMTGAVATFSSGDVQTILVVFVLAFPTAIAAAFFLILWYKPWVLYAPTEFDGTDVSAFVEAMRGRYVAQTDDFLLNEWNPAFVAGYLGDPSLAGTVKEAARSGSAIDLQEVLGTILQVGLSQALRQQKKVMQLGIQWTPALEADSHS